MAIQDTATITGNGGPLGGAPALTPKPVLEQTFQQHLSEHKLAQVIAPPAPVTVPGPGPLMPAPVILNPNAQTGTQQKDYGLTPYKGFPPIPIDTLKPANQPGSSKGAGSSPVTGTVPDSISGPATALTPTNISALNQGLSQISKTLRLQLLSPAAQLAINQVADQSISLNTEYALGLKTPGDGDHLALVGSLRDLIGLLSQAKNAQFFTPMLNADASVTLKGLLQRHAKALNTEALNHTRAQLKWLETASALGHQSFKQLYPNLSLSTVEDRSSAWQNGIGANRQADRLGADLNQNYVLGYQLSVKLNNNTIIQVPVNLVGPLKDLAQFFFMGGDSWLQAGGLTSNKSTGLTPTGVMQRYGVAKASAGDTFNPNQRNENQIGSTVDPQLVKPEGVSGINDEESSISTQLANGSEPESIITVKPGNEDTKKETGVIGLQPKDAIPVPEPEQSGSSDNQGPIKASAADGSPDSGSAACFIALMRYRLDSTIDKRDASLAAKYWNLTQQKSFVQMLGAGLDPNEALLRAFASGVDKELTAAPTGSVDPQVLYTHEQVRLILAAIAQYNLQQRQALERGALNGNELNEVDINIQFLKGLFDEFRLRPANFQEGSGYQAKEITFPDLREFPELIRTALLGLRPALKPVAMRPPERILFEPADMKRLIQLLEGYSRQNSGNESQMFFNWLLIAIPGDLPMDRPVPFAQVKQLIETIGRLYSGVEVPESVLELVTEPVGLRREIILYSRENNVTVSKNEIKLAELANALVKKYTVAGLAESQPELQSPEESEIVSLGKNDIREHMYLMSGPFKDPLSNAVKNSHTLEDLKDAVNQLVRQAEQLGGYEDSIRMLELFLMGLKYREEL